MRGALRSLTTLFAFIFGAGALSPLVEANWHEWAHATGNDQYLVKYAGPIMDKLVLTAQMSWFLFVAGFFVGGAVCLWIDYLLRQRSTAVPYVFEPKNPVVNLSDDLANGLHLVSSTGMNVIVDDRKKVVQIGFRLKNSSSMALRYTVVEISAVIAGKTIMGVKPPNKSSVVAKDDVTTYFFAPIPYTIGKKDVQAEASITYQYGRSVADELPLREANYRIGLTISPKSHHYLIIEENDGKI